MLINHEGRRVIVTGAASGIGRRVAEAFCEAGADVVLCDIDSEGVKMAADEIGGRSYELDVTSEYGWEALDEVFGPEIVDVLVNVAGIGIPGALEELELDQWQKMIDVNLTGTFLGMRYAARRMAKAGGGVIVNISSIAGLIGGEHLAGYSASKGGVTTLTKSAALSGAWRRQGIRCVAIAPTTVDTPILDSMLSQFPSRQAMLDAMAAPIPQGRVATTTDIANATLFVSSDAAEMLNGITIPVDGAQLAGLRSPTSE